MKLLAGLQILLVLALVVFTLIVGVGSALVELSTINEVEVDAAISRAELAANLVTSQLNFTLASASGAAPDSLIRNDLRLQAVVRDAQNYTPSVQYILMADTTDHVILHSDPSLEGNVAAVHPELIRCHGFRASLRQLLRLLREPVVYETRTALALNGRDFGTIRVGVSGSLLRSRMLEIFRADAVKILIQVLLATAFGIGLTWLFLVRPLSRIEKGIRHLQAGDYTYQVPVRSGDELGNIAVQINQLSEMLAHERAVAASEKNLLVSEGDVLRRVVDAVEDGLLMVNGERQVLLANRTATQILDVDFADITGRPLHEALGPDHPLVGVVNRAFSRDRRLESAEIKIGTREGTRSYLADCQVVGEDGEQLGGIVSLRDYGRIRRIQDILDHANVLSRLARIAAGVAHEVRNALNAMNIHLQLLQEKAPALDEGNHLAVVSRESARLERVVFGFLNLSRLQELTLAPIQVGPFLADLVALVTPEARMQGVEMQLDVPSGLPDIYGDQEVLRQAFHNILRNAIQASPPGAPPVVVTAREDPPNQVSLLVRDGGKGISPEARDKIFDLYFTTKKDGTGVGLAMVQQAIDMHRGSIEVNSEPGKGTTFIVRLQAWSSG